MRPPLPLTLLGTAAATAALATGLVACGSSSNSSSGDTTTAPTATTTTPTAPDTTTTATAPVDPEGPVVKVTMGTPNEFSFTLSRASVPAGHVTFEVTNGGAMQHEFVALKTAKPAAKLPTEANGSAKEDGSIGEIPDMAAGTTKRIVFVMKPGHYSLICNLPGHYAGGMRADFTVK